jgi:hypothetical protein
MCKKVLCVGGTFDEKEGRPSGLVRKMCEIIKDDEDINLTIHNGGNVSDLHDNIIQSVKDYDIVMWFANVSNDKVKVRNVKEINPKAILITSKRNDNEKYSFAELVSRALLIKANLTIEFSKREDGQFNMMIFDPLGVEYYNGTDINDMTTALLDRAKLLPTFTRVSTTKVGTGGDIVVPNEEEFFNFAHDCADIFHNLIRPAKNTERFLGNMSFRCQNGFPSFRGTDNLIYVSRRNVDKSDIESTSFVPTYLDEDLNVMYYGNLKPSVDTPVQLMLYSMFPWVNYMLHAHCYVQPSTDIKDYKIYTTTSPVPCGALEEVDEIFQATSLTELNEDTAPRLMAVNLVGHGCILMAKDIEILKELQKYKDNCFVARKLPEQVSNLSTVKNLENR